MGMLRAFLKLGPHDKIDPLAQKNYDYHASMACRHLLAQKNELR